MPKQRKIKPAICPKKNDDFSWNDLRYWPNDNSEPIKKIEPDKEFEEIINFLEGPSNKNPPDALKGESKQSLKIMRKKWLSNRSINEKKWSQLSWYGTWPQLHKVINWCQENHFLHFYSKREKNKWVRIVFTEPYKFHEYIEFPYAKAIWRGPLNSLVEFFLILTNSGAISEPMICDWIAENFDYLLRKKQAGINIYSIRVIWSTLKNASKAGEGKTLTADQRNSLKQILKEIKLAK